jgi:hypothetical protein
MAGPVGEVVLPESREAGKGERGWEDDHGEGGSGTGDEVPMPHNLDLHRSGSREAVETTRH